MDEDKKIQFIDEMVSSICTLVSEGEYMTECDLGSISAYTEAAIKAKDELIDDKAIDDESIPVAVCRKCHDWHVQLKQCVYKLKNRDDYRPSDPLYRSILLSLMKADNSMWSVT